MGKSRIILPIEGMSCASCAATVQEALTSATGVASATVNYATAKAAVDYDDAETGVAELIKTVRMAGYDCGQASVTFGVEQLHYAPSVASLEQALGAVNGVLRAAANQATETVTVDYVPGTTTAEALERAVEQAGFHVAEPIPPRIRSSASASRGGARSATSRGGSRSPPPWRWSRCSVRCCSWRSNRTPPSSRSTCSAGCSCRSR